MMNTVYERGYYMLIMLPSLLIPSWALSIDPLPVSCSISKARRILRETALDVPGESGVDDGDAPPGGELLMLVPPDAPAPALMPPPEEGELDANQGDEWGRATEWSLKATVNKIGSIVSVRLHS